MVKKYEFVKNAKSSSINKYVSGIIFLIVLCLLTFDLTAFALPKGTNKIVQPKNKQEGKSFVKDKAKQNNKNPKEALELTKKGFVFLYKKNYTQAIQCFESSKKSDATYYRAYAGLGDVYSDLKNTRKALSCYKDAIVRLKPDYAYSKIKLARQYEAKKDYENAVKVYKFILQINPTAGNLLLKSRKLKSEGKIYEALDTLKDAISADKNYADAYYNIGILLRDLNNYASAVNYLEKAVKYDEGNSGYLYALGNACYELISSTNSNDQALIDKAADIFEKLLQAGSQQKRIPYMLGNLYILKEKYDKAIEMLSIAIEKFRMDNAETRHSLGNAYFRMGYSIPNIKNNIYLTSEDIEKRSSKWKFYNKALEEYKLSLSKDSSYIIVYYDLGSLYYYKSMFDPDADQVINEINFENAMDYYKGGINYYKKHMLKQSLFYLQKYLSANSNAKDSKQLKQLIKNIKSTINN